MLRDSTDELEFWREVRSGRAIFDIMTDPSFSMPDKRAYALLTKWAARGLVTGGRLGWDGSFAQLTPLGLVTDDPRHPPTRLEAAS